MDDNRSSNKLKFNIVASSVYQLIATIVPIITIPYVTRIFSVEQIGSYNLTYSIVVFASLVSKFGIDTYGVREISKASNNIERDRLYFELFFIQLINSILLFIIVNCLFYFFFEHISKSLTVVQTLLILVNIIDISWFFIGIEAISKTILRNIVTKIFSTTLIFLFVNNASQITLYAFINILGIFLGNVVMIWSSLKILNYKDAKFNLSLIHLKKSFNLFIPKVLNNSYNTIDKTFIEYLSNIENVGLYSEGQKFIKILFSIIEQAFNAISPRMSYYIANKNYSKVLENFSKGLEYCVAFSIIMISGILVVSGYFVDFFYGTGYSQVADVLEILSFALIIVPINGLITSGILIPLSKDYKYRNSTIIMILIGVFFLVIFVPNYGAKGAAFAYILSQVFMLLYLALSVKELINPLIFVKSILKIIFFVILCVYIVHFIENKIVIKNSIIAFLFFGLITTLISCILIFISAYFKKSRFTVNNIDNQNRESQ